MSVTCDEVFDKKPPEEILQDGQPYTRPNMHTENADVNFLHSEKRRRQRLESRRKRYREYQVYYYGTPQEQVERKYVYIYDMYLNKNSIAVQQLLTRNKI